MIRLNSHPSGRHFLQIPGPTNVPDRVLRAMARPTIDHRGPEFAALSLDILERHHRYKKDSPSGTALHFAHIVQEGMGQQRLQHGREGLVGERPAFPAKRSVPSADRVFRPVCGTSSVTHRAPRAAALR